jgi:hypothetical protein
MAKATFTKHVSLKDFYAFYEKKCIDKNLKPRPYKEYAKLLRDFNNRVRDKVIYNSAIFAMPYRLGTLYIRKFEVSYTEENKKTWLIDFKKTKEQGITVYFGSPYGYKWQWYKKTCVVKGKRYYTFKPCRKASRMIADAINNKKLDYYNQ